MPVNAQGAGSLGMEVGWMKSQVAFPLGSCSSLQHLTALPGGCGPRSGAQRHGRLRLPSSSKPFEDPSRGTPITIN